MNHSYLKSGNPGVPVPAAAAAAAQKLMRTDRLEVGMIHWFLYAFFSNSQVFPWPKWVKNSKQRSGLIYLM
jgi:hypothetical protein